MNVHFVVTLSEKEMEKAEAQGLLEYFKLTGKINTSNMMCFDFDGKIKKYNSPEEIIEDFYPMRLAWYQKRKVSTHLPQEEFNFHGPSLGPHGICSATRTREAQ